MKYQIIFLFPLLAMLISQKAVRARPFEVASRGCRPEDGFFRCGSGECIYRIQVKNSFNECADLSDETEDLRNCTDDEITCRGNYRCALRWLVNTRAGCQIAETSNYPCRPYEFQCIRGKTCIPRWMVADGNFNCNGTLVPDVSDEVAGFQTCLDTEFKCDILTTGTSRCIPRDWVMDNYTDCPNGRDEVVPFKTCYNHTEFRCTASGRCIPRYRVLDGFSDCSDSSDEMQALSCIDDMEFMCTDSGRCLPRSWRGNALINCKDGSDEVPMEVNETCLDGEFRCHNNRRCIPTYLLCDGTDHCGDCSDEIESCDEQRMFRCPSEPEKCFYWGYSCDQFEDCANGTDDIKFLPGFKCQKDHAVFSRYCSIPQWMLDDDFAHCDDNSDLCLTENGTLTCSRCLDGKTVIASRQVCDGIVDCPDFSDECLCSGTRASQRVVQFCESVTYAGGNTNCPAGSLLCPERNDCLSSSQVCDGKTDCPESKLDEKLCTLQNQQTANTEEYDFECDPLHPVLRAAIPATGLGLLFDSFIPPRASRCDGITECMNHEDECSERANCTTRLSICDAVPLVDEVFALDGLGLTEPVVAKVKRCSGPYNFAFGKAVCNGVYDCEDGIDELYCEERRFACDGGTQEWPLGFRQVVSIPLGKRCDGEFPPDCVDGKDELGCSASTHFYCENGDPLFVKAERVLDGRQDCSDYSDECPKDVFSEGGISSREELIKSPALRVLVWFMAVFATFGNIAVVFAIGRKLTRNRRNQRKQNSKVAVSNSIMIINLSVADFLMGVALLIVAIRSLQFKGEYCLFDKVWRTSGTCTALGVLIVLSSQSSVFTLVVITSYRLYFVLNPIKVQQMRMRYLYAWLALVWLVAFLISLLPLSTHLTNSMITGAWITPSPYFPTDTIALTPYQEFTRRISALSLSSTNLTETPPVDWYGMERYLGNHFPDFAPNIKGYFGYYSASGMCIPKLYRISADEHENHPMTFAVMTFNFIALIYIIIAYVTIYRHTTVNSLKSSASQQKHKQLYRKITLLIVTDLACWFPLCIMTFMSMANIVLPPVAYTMSAIIFLPINSSLNPLIYTNPLSLLYKRCITGWNFVRARVVVTVQSSSNLQTADSAQETK